MAIKRITKICKTCSRSFTWRKKWQRDWDNVYYCSKRCRQTQGRKTKVETHCS
ncbi:MAG: hypothetical protein CMQ30_06580 [Gammaproteobacteria bacterium]|nr:hypothetical protein [Gammaproteobacteria bacterium]